MPLFLAQTSPDGHPCGSPEEASSLCRQLYELTSNETVARASDLIVVTPAKITFILLIAWASSRLLKQSIRRSRGAWATCAPTLRSAVDRTAGTLLRTSPVTSTRANQRAETIGALIGSVGTLVVWSSL